MALFIIRDEPELRLRGLLNDACSENIENSRWLLQSYFISRHNPATGWSPSTLKGPVPSFIIRDDTDDDYIYVVCDALDETDDEECRVFLILTSEIFRQRL